MEEKDKNIDESWKDEVLKEKDKLRGSEDTSAQAPDFKFFITTLAIQAAICLGIMNNPVTNQKEENLTQAKFIIDTLDMLKEKTKGNLNQEEAEVLENMLYDLRMQFLEKNKGVEK